MNLDRLNGYIAQNAERWLGQLAELVAEPSLSAEGRRLEETAARVAAQLEALGATVRVHRFPGIAPVVVGTVGEGPKTLLLYNHYDVQPPDPLHEWTVPPFEMTRRDGLLLGRGVADDKGDLVARIAGAECVQKLCGRLPLKLIFMVEGEEEIGSPSLATVVDRLKGELAADGCLWESGNRTMDGRPVVQAGVKGMCYVELVARGAKVDMHSSMATLVPNPAWRLTWALATLKNERDEITLDGLLERFRAPEPEARRLAREVPFDPGAFKDFWGIDHFTQERGTPELMDKHLLEPTCTICGLTSGYQGPGSKTVLPHEARAKVDFRLVPDLTPDYVLERLRAHLDRRGFTDIEVIDVNGEEPYRSSASDPVVRAARDAAREATGVEPVLWPNMAGTGPMAQVCGRLGMPAVGFGVGHSASRLHAPDENIHMQHFLECIAHAALFMEKYAAAGD